ncbi:initiator tRNA phosphoribosyl transferase [Flammula alnicola]|nr:initiator tRNA phosphoribosyl transferase [Flammula alnicola]
MEFEPNDHLLVSEKSDDAFSYLRKESLDIFNRLHSIEEDLTFVEQVQKNYPNIPLLPNLRCGAWYTDPAISTDAPAYFKSTDGHFNNWSFNLRRANLHLLPLIIERQGMILVDSTRSGKRIPDALSKTVPIWCAVINRAMPILHPNSGKGEGNPPWDTALYTPPSAVSVQEHHQIEKHLDGWAHALAASSFSLPVLPIPLRPVWITPVNSTFPEISASENNYPDFLPVICVSASKQIEQAVERRSSGFSYIQGSGDDHELWGMGLTPEMFWKHRSELLAADRAQLSKLVTEIVSAQRTFTAANRTLTPPTSVAKVGGRLLLCALSEVPESSQDTHAREHTVYVILDSVDRKLLSTDSRLYVPVISGKKGQSHFLQTVLPMSLAFIGKHLREGKNVCVACESGKETSVGVVLAALQQFFGDDGSFLSSNLDSEGDNPSNTTNTDKTSIRTRLEWIIASRPQANPSRAVLKRVNEFLLTAPSFREPSSGSTP